MRVFPFASNKVYPGGKPFFYEKVRYCIGKMSLNSSIKHKKGAAAPFNKLNLLMKILGDLLQNLQQYIKLALQWCAFTGQQGESTTWRFLDRFNH